MLVAHKRGLAENPSAISKHIPQRVTRKNDTRAQWERRERDDL